MVYIIVKNKNTREADRREAYAASQSSITNLRNAGQRSLDRINKETRKIESMREQLVQATREGNQAEVKDIHEFVKSHSEYQNK